jgi:hypothetical protein
VTEWINRRQIQPCSQRNDEFAFDRSDRARRYDKAATWFLRECLDCGLDVPGIAHAANEAEAASITRRNPMCAAICGTWRNTTRRTVGAISLTTSNHFPRQLGFKIMGKVLVDVCLGEGRRSQWVFLNADALTVKRQW